METTQTKLPKRVKILFDFIGKLGIYKDKEYDVVPCPDHCKDEYSNHVWVVSETNGKPFLLQVGEYTAVKSLSMQKLEAALNSLD